MKNIINIFYLLLLFNTVNSQVIPFNSDQWDVQSQSYILEEYEGRQSVYLQDGWFLLKDHQFINGIIEFDLLLTNRRAFPGVIFRMIDEQNYEEFYIRAHLSGQPDANQYTPVFNGNSAWQLYFGPSYSTPTVYPYGQWMHLKILILDDKAEIYFNNEPVPSLIVKLKMTLKAGRIGFKNALSPMHFANFQYQKTDNVPLYGKAPVIEPVQDNIIDEWQISDSFSEKQLQDFELSSTLKYRSWTTLKAEPSGTVNISRIAKKDPNLNTVFARVVINSDKKQIKELSLGYSDRARVFLNGQLLYSGDNSYKSRDYRYLGTIGYFDKVYLPLKKGKNELWIAVSETFGGWGIRGVIDDVKSITIE